MPLSWVGLVGPFYREHKICGGNGCGGSCGVCPPGLFCQGNGSCAPTCQTVCEARACGPDGCGGECGACEGGLICTIDGQCGSACALCPTLPACLDLGFESGSLAGWSVQGEPLVLPGFGKTTPPEGAFFLDLDSGVHEREGATLQICLPAGVTALTFLWKLYSEEFTEFCGTDYNDGFRVVVGNESTHATLFERVIGDLCEASICIGCGAHAVPLTPSDIHFDQGDAWTTPWIKEVVPLQGWAVAGEVLVLTFEVNDAGDGIYDTHALVDDVAFLTGCAPECAGKQCGPDGCGGFCGGCGVGQPCSDDGTCLPCQSACEGKVCGPDGCGGTCGTCPPQAGCQEGICVVCQPDCEDKACGADGCGGTCSACAAGETCSQGVCVAGAGMGEPCDTDTNCAEGLVCVEEYQILPTGAFICSVACTPPAAGQPDPCPDGFMCMANPFLPGEDRYCTSAFPFPG